VRIEGSPLGTELTFGPIGGSAAGAQLPAIADHAWTPSRRLIRSVRQWLRRPGRASSGAFAEPLC